MSEALDQETQKMASQIQELLDSIMTAAESLRTKILAKEIDPRSGMRGELPGSLIVDVYALRDSRYLACLYNLDLLFHAVFNNNRILNCVDAVFLKYDSHHAKWSVEAFSFIDKHEKFRQKVVSYRPLWLKGRPLLTPVMLLNRADTA